MKTVKAAFALICLTSLTPLLTAQDAKTLSAADARNHVGETATVCGKVVDTKVQKYGLKGRGKPVSFDLDQPEPNPIFYFVTFGSESGGPQEAIDAYQGKQVCVTGKISAMASGPPLIMAADRTQIKPQPSTK